MSLSSWNLVDALRSAEELGLRDVLLPFLLVFAIVFAVLQNSNILGKDKKNLNVILAIVMGLALVIPHVMDIYPEDRDAVDIINKAVPNLSFVVIILFAFLLVIGILGAETQSHSGATFAVIVIGAVIAIFFINESHPEIAPLVLAVAFFLTLGLAFFRSGSSDKSKIIPGWIFIIAFGFVFVIFLNAAGWTEMPEWLDWLEDSKVQALLIFGIVAFAIIGFVTRESKF
jgi:membrane protease YdiL (CAAX protease family)